MGNLLKRYPGRQATGVTRGLMVLALPLSVSLALAAMSGAHAALGRANPPHQIRMQSARRRDWDPRLSYSNARAARQSARRGARHSLADLPSAAQALVSRTLGRHSPLYRVRTSAAGLVASNPANRLVTRFDRFGVHVTAAGGTLGLALSTAGFSGSERRVSPLMPRGVGNRVSYRRAGLVEWYANGPMGVGQGFTVAAPTRPPGSAGSFELRFAVSGDLRPMVTSHGQAVVFRSPSGRAVLAYRDLVVVDAHGQRLSATIRLSGATLAIRVDTVGARYPLRIDPLIESASVDASSAELGYSVAISGGTIVAGARLATVNGNPGAGALYVFSEPSGGWVDATQTAVLTASDGASYDGLGTAVGISGGTVVASAPDATVNGNRNAGAVYVFSEPSAGWVDATQTAVLTASDGTSDDELGISIGISGGTVVAGAPGATVNGNPGAGAVYVFSEPSAGWVDATQTAKLTASDGASTLGSSVGISGGTVVAGAPNATVNGNPAAGAVYVFSEPSAGWVDATQTAKLTASDGAAFDELGYSVAISGGTIVAGALYATVNGNKSAGAVYVFSEPSAGWVDATQTAKLTASDRAQDDRLGASVGISGGTIVAGAPGATVNGNFGAGAVYVFSQPSSGGWVDATQTAKLTASDGALDDGLGAYSVAIGGGTIVAGAPFATVNGNEDAGAAYVFSEPSSGGWVDAQQTAKLTAAPMAVPMQTLTVAVNGPGKGTVSSDPAGISCPGTCSAQFPTGTSVALTASPSGTSSFAGWGGACSGRAGSCSITMTADESVSATFGPSLLTLASTSAAPEIVGKAQRRTLALFTDTNSLASPQDFSVTINWGDGTTSPGLMGHESTLSGDFFTVDGSHVYQSRGSFTVTIKVSSLDGGFVATTKANSKIATNETSHCAQSVSWCFETKTSHYSAVWGLHYGLSPHEGLVMFNVTDGPRLLAERMSVPYLNLTTCQGLPCDQTSLDTSERHVVLAPYADETSQQQTSAPTQVLLVSGPDVREASGANFGPCDTPHPAAPCDRTIVSATYRVFLGLPNAAATSYVDVTQRYAFYNEFNENDPNYADFVCEPGIFTKVIGSGLEGCSRWKPLVDYQFVPGQGQSSDQLQSLNAAARILFTPDSLAVRSTAFVHDCGGLFTCFNSSVYQNCSALSGWQFCVFPPTGDEQNPITHEVALRLTNFDPTTNQTSGGLYDNLHISADSAVDLPLPPPGCPDCVHIHWRWGAVGDNHPSLGFQQPMLCDGEPYPIGLGQPNSFESICQTNQQVDLALATYHSDEGTPTNFMQIIDGCDQAQVNEVGFCEGTEPLAQNPLSCYDRAFLVSWGQCGVALWLSGTTYASTSNPELNDTLFAFGGFFCSTCGPDVSNNFTAAFKPTYRINGKRTMAGKPGSSVEVDFPNAGFAPDVDTLSPLEGSGIHLYYVLPRGATNWSAQVVEGSGNTCSFQLDGSGRVALGCTIYPVAAPLQGTDLCAESDSNCVVVKFRAPTTPGDYDSDVHAAWAQDSSTSPDIGGNFRNTDVLRLR